MGRSYGWVVRVVVGKFWESFGGKANLTSGFDARDVDDPCGFF